MKKANEDIRKTAIKAGVKLWQVGERYGLNDGNYSRLLRKELDLEKKTQIFKIIEELRMEAS